MLSIAYPFHHLHVPHRASYAYYRVFETSRGSITKRLNLLFATASSKPPGFLAARLRLLDIRWNLNREVGVGPVPIQQLSDFLRQMINLRHFRLEVQGWKDGIWWPVIEAALTLSIYDLSLSMHLLSNKLLDAISAPTAPVVALETVTHLWLIKTPSSIQSNPELIVRAFRSITHILIPLFNFPIYPASWISGVPNLKVMVLNTSEVRLRVLGEEDDLHNANRLSNVVLMDLRSDPWYHDALGVELFWSDAEDRARQKAEQFQL